MGYSARDDMDYFTYITGIATLVGLGMQIFDSLPTYRSYRQAIFYLLLGLFLGSLVTTFDGSKIKFSFELSGYALLVFLIAFVIVWTLHLAYKSERDEFFAVSGIGAFILVVVLAFGNLEPAINEAKKLTINELILLSKAAEEKQNYDRAIEHQMSILSKLHSSDSRRDSITKKIDELKENQLN